MTNTTNRPASNPETKHVVVVGGGPAGLAAAVAASKEGARVTLVEASDQLGGQFWRHLPVERAGAKEAKLHHNWDTYVQLRESVLNSDSCEVLLEAQVWAIEIEDAKPVLNVVVGNVDDGDRTPVRLYPDALVLATGAHDRTLPFPGWDLPGVFTAGAAQAFAKSERIAVGERVVVAGAGPFLLPVMSSLAAANAKLVGVFEANRLGNLKNWLLNAPWKLAGAAHKGGELVEYLTTGIRYRIPYHLGTGVIAAHGKDRVEEVTVAKLDSNWEPIPGTEKRYKADAVCVSHGFTPRLELAIAVGCEILPTKFVRVNKDQETSVPNVFAAGEITSIGGCDAALAEGEIAGHRAAGGKRESPQLRKAVRMQAVFNHFASRLEAAHGIRKGWTKWLEQDTLLCRCEETKYGSFCDTISKTESSGLRSAKLTTRAGLGICQGRICGRNVEAILTQLTGDSSGDGARTDRRPIVSPVRLGDIANFDNKHPAPSTSFESEK